MKYDSLQEILQKLLELISQNYATKGEVDAKQEETEALTNLLNLLAQPSSGVLSGEGSNSVKKLTQQELFNQLFRVYEQEDGQVVLEIKNQ